MKQNTSFSSIYINFLKQIQVSFCSTMYRYINKYLSLFRVSLYNENREQIFLNFP